MHEEPHEFEILPADEMQRKYGLYAENRTKVKIDPSDVPVDLRELIPFAEKFGVICDITRHDLGGKVTQKEKDELSDALRGKHARINEWLNSFHPADGSISDIDNPATSYFVAMCVFEVEENQGPGLAGDPAYAAKRKLRRKEEDLIRRRNARNGPPCRKCGEPLRTPLAKRCFECGTNVNEL